MKKKIIAMSLCAGISLFAEMGINDLELLGQNVLKNNADIKQLKIDLYVLSVSRKSYFKINSSLPGPVETIVTGVSKYFST